MWQSQYTKLHALVVWA